MNSPSLDDAVKALRSGGVIAYPTEAVWGLGCDPFNEPAVRRLLQLKQRPQAKGMIMVASGVDMIRELFAPLGDEQWQLLAATWPGPNTWIIPVQSDRVPEWVRGEHQTQAFRVSAHPGVKALCEAFGGPIISTSANISSFPPALSSSEVEAQFGAAIDVIVPGELGGSDRPTIIRDIVTGDVIRP